MTCPRLNLEIFNSVNIQSLNIWDNTDIVKSRTLGMLEITGISEYHRLAHSLGDESTNSQHTRVEVLLRTTLPRWSATRHASSVIALPCYF
jgi:hypothetical protein